MTSPLEVRFTLARAEVTSTIRWLTWRKLRLPAMVLGVFALLVEGAIVVLYAVTGRTQDLAWALPLPAFFAATFLYSAFVAPALAYRRLPRTFREGGHFWRFSDEGVEFRGPTVEAKFLWSTWIAFAESAECFLLFPQREQAHMIPKRAFASAEEIDRFRSLARGRIVPA